ncbi:MAG: hypothetical protein AAF961_12670, partial [Planctomycetota bacterium]
MPRTTLRDVLLVMLAVTLGCDAPQLPDAGQATADATAGDDPAGAAGTDATTEDEDMYDRAALVNRAQADVPDPGDVEEVTDEPREFTANDPVRGRRSRAAGGYLGAVGGARFWAEHQAII